MTQAVHGAAGARGERGTTVPRVAHVAVVVPVRDEEVLLGRCLTALGAARDVLTAGDGPTVDVVVVLDRCRDTSAQVAARHPGIRTVVLDAGDVGAARRAGVRAALGTAAVRDDHPHGLRALRDPATTWVLATDADSEVRPDWLVEHVRLADAGADVVVGTVHPDPADLTPAQWAAWRATHVPGQPNGHVHGANLGVRASAYLRAGGFVPAAEHEDVDLVARLRATGAHVVASDAVDVLTSGRPHGRTPGGYAGHLRATLLRA